MLKTTLAMCGNRIVVFDNMTKDEVKIWRQRKELLSLIDDAVDKNDGKLYTNDLFYELKREQMNQIDRTFEGKSLEREVRIPNEEQFKRFIGMVESRLKECVLILEKQLAEERAARVEAEVKVLEAQSKSNDEVHEMKERLMRAEEKSRELEDKLKNKYCAIM